MKHVTALHPLVFARRGRRGGLPLPLALLPYAVFAASFLPFLSSLRVIRDNVLLYGTGLTGARGQRPGGLRPTCSRRGRAGRYLFFGLCLAFVAVAAIELGRRLPLRARLPSRFRSRRSPARRASRRSTWCGRSRSGASIPSVGYVLFTTLGAGFMVSEAETRRRCPSP